MNEKFFDIKKEKQDRILNAALKAFALHGYRHASTDDIVRDAAVSKGILFHYFGSKLGLYEFVYEYSVRFMLLELSGAVESYEDDLFEIASKVELARMRAMKGYPYMQQFLNRTAAEDVSEALIAMEEKRGVLEDAYEQIYGQIDFSKYGGDVLGRKILKMLDLTVKGLMTERFLDASFQPEMLYEEIEEYIRALKTLCTHE